MRSLGRDHILLLDITPIYGKSWSMAGASGCNDPFQTEYSGNSIQGREEKLTCPTPELFAALGKGSKDLLRPFPK